jgi:hypothetical protein
MDARGITVHHVFFAVRAFISATIASLNDSESMLAIAS